MKLALISLALLLSAPEAAVRFETEGVRIGSELVSGKQINLKNASALPILVSGSVVENLTADGKLLAVAVAAEKSVLLETGVRLERTADGFRLSTHGPAFTVASGGTSIALDGPAAFKVVDSAFDFGAKGKLEGASIVAKVTPPQGEPGRSTPQDPRRRMASMVRSNQARLVFGNTDPASLSIFANGESLRQLDQVTPTGAP